MNKKKQDQNQLASSLADSLSLSNPFECINEGEDDRKSDIKRNLPSDLMSILKKYQKRDSNSRLKAYEELIGYAGNEIEENKGKLVGVIETDLINWVSDSERRIREYAITLVSLMIQKEKSHMQDIFKNIMYPLLTCLFDPIPSVCSASKLKIFDRYFSDKTKFSKVLQHARENILKGIYYAVYTEKTYEETIYEETDAQFMLERRIGCAFEVFSFVKNEFKLHDLECLGGSSLIIKILKKIPDAKFCKKSIYACIFNNFELFEGTRGGTLDEQVFTECIINRYSFAYNLIPKYLKGWLADSRKQKQMCDFLMDEFEYLCLNLVQLKEIANQKFLIQLASGIFKNQQKFIPKHFFKYLEFMIFFERPSEEIIKFLQDHFEYKQILGFSMKQIDPIDSLITFNFILDYFQKRYQFIKNKQFFIAIILNFSKYNRNRMFQFFNSDVDLSTDCFLDSTLYLNLLLEYPDLESKLCFESFSIQERVNLLITQSKNISNSHISNSHISIIFPYLNQETFTLDQKHLLLEKLNLDLFKGWENDHGLFLSILLSNSIKNKNRIIGQFCRLEFLCKFMREYFMTLYSNEEIQELLFGLKDCFPIEFQALLHFLANVSHKIPIITDFGSFLNHLNPFLNSHLVDTEGWFQSKFFLQIPYEYFDRVWDFVVENGILDKYFVYIAMNPIFFQRDSKFLISILNYELQVSEKFIYYNQYSISTNENILPKNSHKYIRKFLQTRNLIDISISDQSTVEEILDICDVQFDHYSNEIKEKIPLLPIEITTIQDARRFLYKNNPEFDLILLKFFFEKFVELLPVEPEWYYFVDNFVNWLRKHEIIDYPDEWKENSMLLLLNKSFLNVHFFLFDILCKGLAVDSRSEIFCVLVDPVIESADCINLQNLLPFCIAVSFGRLSEPLEKYDNYLKMMFLLLIHGHTNSKFIFNPSVNTIEKAFEEYLLIGSCFEENFLFLAASNALVSLLKQYPAHLRTLLNSPCYQLLNNFIIYQISPWIIREELQSVASYPTNQLNSPSSPGSMTLRSYQSSTSKSIQAIYSIEEVRMELNLQFPSNYPLTPPILTTGQRAGVPERQWRAWQLSTRSVLCNQDSSLLDALLLWKQNADKRFEGVEDCTICVSVFQPTDRSLPTQECRTCHQKFHSSCLFKWFASCGNSTCPLCRGFFK